MGRRIRVIDAADVPDGRGIRVTAAGREIAIFRVEGRYLAVDALCTHAGAPLDQGTLDGPRITCPWHGAVFDLRDGSPCIPPASLPLGTYPVHREGGALLLEL